MDKLLASLRPGGIGVLHLTFSNPGYKKWKLTRMIPFNKQLRNMRNRKPLNTPVMQMNEYDLNKTMKKIMDIGVKSCFIECTNHDGIQGVKLYFQRS